MASNTLEKKRKFSSTGSDICMTKTCIQLHANHQQPYQKVNNIPQVDGHFNGYMTFLNMHSLAAALSGLDVFHHVLSKMCNTPILPNHEFHLHVEAVGRRALVQGSVVHVLHLRASKIRQPHVDAQERMLDERTGRFPLFGIPRGTQVGPLIYVTNNDELYKAAAEICGVDAIPSNINELRKQKTDVVLQRYCNSVESRLRTTSCIQG